jgi:aspartyl-tRNA(Asn)/glutamyl-tRNA(Gln) amidotransferase subunit A
MARRVRDVALALDVVVGPDARDIRSLPREFDSWSALLEAPVRPPRAAWAPTLGYAEIDREVLGICEQAVKQLEALGTEIVEVEDVFGDDPTTHVGTLVSTFILRTVEPYLGTDRTSEMDPMVVIAAEMARVTTNAIDVVKAYDACHLVNAKLQDVLDTCDVLLCPTVSGTATPAEAKTTVVDLLARLGGLETFDTSTLPDGIVQDLLARLSGFGEFNFPMGLVNGERVLDWTRMTQPFNLTRSPAGTVNAGFTDAGLPVGLQIVGQQHGDAGVLQTIAVLEDALGLDALAPI